MADKIFDLEQEIMHCWNVTSDIDVVLNESCEGNLTHDETQNLLLGLKSLYEIRFNILFRAFEEHCKDYWKYRKTVEGSSAFGIDNADR
jgi:hypothetical protein